MAKKTTVISEIVAKHLQCPIHNKDECFGECLIGNDGYFCRGCSKTIPFEEVVNPFTIHGRTYEISSETGTDIVECPILRIEEKVIIEKTLIIQWNGKEIPFDIETGWEKEKPEFKIKSDSIRLDDDSLQDIKEKFNL